jgi:hypothetical protein
MPNIMSRARTAPPPNQPPLPGRLFGCVSEAVVAAVVLTVKTTVPLVPSVIGEPAPPPEQIAPSPPVAVLERSWQVSVTVPVYPPAGDTVAVTVAEAPGAIPALVPAATGEIADCGVLRVKVDDVTVTFAEPVADWYTALPE